MSRTRLWLAAAVVVAAVIAVVLALRLRPPLVDVVTADEGPLVQTVLFSARVATPSRVDLGSTVTGRVAEVKVQAGQSVTRGSVLIQLETDEPEAALAQAVAGEIQARARLAGLLATVRPSAKAAIDQTEAAARATDAEWARVRALVGQGFLSESRLDDARRAADVARAQLAAAQAQALAVADGGADLRQAQAQLDLARATVQAAQARVAQTRVVAPADARVLQRLVEPGQIVQPGKALLNLALTGPVQIVALVDERYLQSLRPGQAATAVADAFPERRFAARLATLAPLVDAQRGTVEVKLDVEPPTPDFLREDLTLSVEVETARRERAVALPAAAVTPDTDGQSMVRVVRDGHIAQQAVTTGLRTLDAVEITAGLRAGDLVVADGSDKRPAGTAVRTSARAWRAQRDGAGPRGAPPDAGTSLGQSMGR